MFHPQGPTFWELARQALSSTERGYDLLAPKFDFTPFRTPTSVLVLADRVMTLRSPFERAIDLCCGTGAGMEMLRPLAKEVVGVDMSQGMLEIAKAHADQWSGDGELRFERGNVLDEQVVELGPFDAAVCFGALGHIPVKDEARFLRNVYALLRPGGRFYFASFEKPPWWSLGSILARGFNAAMHVRNLLIRPPFIMFYLTFLLPKVEQQLRDAGFDVVVHECEFPRGLRMVEAVRPEER